MSANVGKISDQDMAGYVEGEVVTKEEATKYFATVKKLDATRAICGESTYAQGVNSAYFQLMGLPHPPTVQASGETSSAAEVIAKNQLHTIEPQRAKKERVSKTYQAFEMRPLKDFVPELTLLFLEEYKGKRVSCETAVFYIHLLYQGQGRLATNPEDDGGDMHPILWMMDRTLRMGTDAAQNAHNWLTVSHHATNQELFMNDHGADIDSLPFPLLPVGTGFDKFNSLNDKLLRYGKESRSTAVSGGGATAPRADLVMYAPPMTSVRIQRTGDPAGGGYLLPVQQVGQDPTTGALTYGVDIDIVESALGHTNAAVQSHGAEMAAVRSEVRGLASRLERMTSAAARVAPAAPAFGNPKAPAPKHPKAAPKPDKKNYKGNLKGGEGEDSTHFHGGPTSE